MRWPSPRRTLTVRMTLTVRSTTRVTYELTTVRWEYWPADLVLRATLTDKRYTEFGYVYLRVLLGTAVA